MAKATILIGNAEGVSPSAATAEDAAQEYFYNRGFVGMFAPRPPVERWRPAERERFEAELARLEDAQRSQTAL